MNCLVCGAAHTACGGETPAPQFIITMEVDPMPAYFATERLYLDKDGKVVKEGDPTKASLLAPVGGMIPEERAKELGLLEEKAKAEPVENKARASAPANKAKA